MSFSLPRLSRHMRPALAALAFSMWIFAPPVAADSPGSVARLARRRTCRRRRAPAQAATARSIRAGSPARSLFRIRSCRRRSSTIQSTARSGAVRRRRTRRLQQTIVPPTSRASSRSSSRPRPDACCRCSAAASSARRPSNFAPVDNVPVSADYTVGPGDEIVVRAWGSIDIDYRAVVDRNGQMNLPQVGSFTVAGVRPPTSRSSCARRSARLYTNFNLSVSLGQMRGVKVFVVGPARLPGVFTLSSQSTLLSAVVAAGGPGPNGSMRKDQPAPRRPGRLRARRLRLPGAGRQVEGPAARAPATWSCSIRSVRAWRSTASSTTRRSTNSRRARSRSARCCATPAARRCWRIRTARCSNASTRRSRGAARFVEEFKLDAGGPAEAAARRRRADAADRSRPASPTR